MDVSMRVCEAMRAFTYVFYESARTSVRNLAYCWVGRVQTLPQIAEQLYAGLVLEAVICYCRDVFRPS